MLFDAFQSNDVSNLYPLIKELKGEPSADKIDPSFAL